jgi:serine protease Do
MALFGLHLTSSPPAVSSGHPSRTPRFCGAGEAFALLLFSWLLLRANSVSAAAVEPDIRRDATVIAIERVLPSVVNIATETVIEYHEWYDTMLRQFYGWSRTPVHQEKSVSLGSGVIIDEEGYVLTNLHVVRRASRIQVKLWDGREYDAEPLVATPGSDVALLRLRAKPGEKFKAIQFAADDDLLLGETVIALGNPFGLGGSVTKGILSAKTRRPASGNEPLDVQDWLQTDAAINPGNSGGPLVNLRGELIGLNVAVYRGDGEERGIGVGVGFSIPVKQVSAALSRFFSPEVTDSLWFGAQLKPGSTPLEISAVQPGSPASRAGLRGGDHLLQVNGKTPQGLIDCNRMLANPERSAQLLVERGGRRETLSVALISFQDLIRRRVGVTLSHLTQQAASRLRVNADSALVISAVEKGSPAERSGLQSGYVLLAIEGRKTTSLGDVAEVLLEKQPRDTVQLTVVAPRSFGGMVQLQQGTITLELR